MIADKVADTFCLMAHDERSGRARVHPDTLGLGLAAALLAELVLPPFLVQPPGALPFTKHLTIHNGLVSLVTIPPAAPYDALQHWVLETVAAEPEPLSVDVWLRLLARDADRRVIDRLARHGMTAPPEEPSGLGKLRNKHARSPLCRPVDPDWAAFLPVQLRGRLHDPSAISLGEVVLVGLVAATELIHHVVLWDGGQLPRHVCDLLRRFPPPLRELISHTEATLANVVLAR